MARIYIHFPSLAGIVYIVLMQLWHLRCTAFPMQSLTFLPASTTNLAGTIPVVAATTRHHRQHPTKIKSATWMISSSSSSSSSKFSSLSILRSTAVNSNNNNDDDNEVQDDGVEPSTIVALGIDVSLDPRLYKVRLSRASGIDWGTDLSFSFVYVRGMDPTGSAALSGVVQIGDQICESTPVSSDSTTSPVNLIGASFDSVMNTWATLDNTVKELDLVFFRGSKAELKAICTGTDGTTGLEPEYITVTVVQNKGSENEMIKQFTAPPGVNVRELLVNNGVNVYQSVTRWTNCSGKQLCGTCIVNIPRGGISTNRKSMDEGSTLRENPDTYRLSCVTFAYGDITVETFPPIKAAQWTR